MSTRSCERCHAPLIKRDNEPPSRFAVRRFCGVGCAIRATVKRPRPALRLCDWETFIAAWRAAGSVAEVAARFSISPDQATRLAGKMRERGVDLKNMTRPPRVAVSAELVDRLIAEAARRGCSAESIVEEALKPLL